MKRIDITALLLVMAALMAPFTMGAADVALKSWSDGPLTWNDFLGQAVIKGESSYMKAFLAIMPTEMSAGKTNALYRLEASAVMNTSVSFADTKCRTAQRLRYHQLQFDVLEYMLSLIHI